LGIGIRKLIIGILLELRGHTLLLVHPSCRCVLGASIRQYVHIGNLAHEQPNAGRQVRLKAGAQRTL
jgi:hypothetical protein